MYCCTSHGDACNYNCIAVQSPEDGRSAGRNMQLNILWTITHLTIRTHCLYVSHIWNSDYEEFGSTRRTLCCVMTTVGLTQPETLWRHLTVFPRPPCDFHIFPKPKENIRGHYVTGSLTQMKEWEGHSGRTWTRKRSAGDLAWRVWETSVFVISVCGELWRLCGRVPTGGKGAHFKN